MPAAERRDRPPIRTAALMICTRDRPQELADCLATCAALTGPPALRIVVCVADNNAEPQEDVIRLLAAQHGLDLRYGHEPERGYASVRNRALELALAAGADIGIFIDDDSTAHPDLVIGHVAAMNRYDADAVLGRIEGLSQRPREGRRVRKAGTGNVSIRRWVFDTAPGGAGLRFDPRLNLLGFEDWEFFGDLVRRGGAIYQSTEPVSISRPGVEAAPTSAERSFAERRAFAVMEGRNEIAVARMRHGLAAASVKAARRIGPLLVRGVGGLVGAAFVSLRDARGGRAQNELSRLRLAKAAAAITGLWRPGYERPAARQGVLIELRSQAHHGDNLRSRAPR